MTEIKVRAPKVGKEATIQYEFPSDMAGLVAKFGEAEVFAAAKAQFTIAIQARMRTLLEGGSDLESITRLVNEWRPGVVVRTAVDPVAALKNKLATMDSESAKAILAELRKAAMQG